LISVQTGMQKNDVLRQAIGYEYPNYPWEKDNYFIRPEYRSLMKEVLASLNEKRPQNRQEGTIPAEAPPDDHP
jgi:hypothetical protein